MWDLYILMLCTLLLYVCMLGFFHTRTLLLVLVDNNDMIWYDQKWRWDKAKNGCHDDTAWEWDYIACHTTAQIGTTLSSNLPCDRTTASPLLSNQCWSDVCCTVRHTLFVFVFSNLALSPACLACTRNNEIVDQAPVRCTLVCQKEFLVSHPIFTELIAWPANQELIRLIGNWKR